MSLHVTDVEGDWKIVDYPQHPECIGCQIKIKGHGLDPNLFQLHVHVVNYLTCLLEHHSANDRWESSNFFSTAIPGSHETIDNEHFFRKLVANIQKLEVHDEHVLTMKTNDGQLVRLERLP